MNLTREQAIAEHRKMWLWISRQIMKDYVANEKVRTIYSYKCDYLNCNFPNEKVKSKCFCCEYAAQHSGSCYKDCPLYWNDRNTILTCCESLGYYDVINKIPFSYLTGQDEYYRISNEEAKRMARMAYKIAMLPVKEK